MSEDEIVEVPKKKRSKKVLEEVVLEEIQIEEVVPHLDEDTNSEAPEPIVVDLPEVFKQPIEQDPAKLIDWDSAEPLQEPEQPALDPEPTPEPEVAKDSSAAAGQGSWHGKHNLARSHQSVAARKYTPAHRQR